MTFKEVIDDLRVERLERLVQKQKPASAPWTPVTDYSFEARRAIEGKHPELILETFHPHAILDAGCGRDGHLVRLLNQEQPMWPCYVEGWDVAVPSCGDFYQRDITAPLRSTDRRDFDLVICREVLEHLTIRQVAVAVRNLVKLSSRYIYVTTRFAKNPTHLLDVDTADDLDPTHITMLTKPFLRTLFVLEGCKSRPDLEAKMDWQNKGRCLVFEVV